jgi:hypothetical protein
VAKPHHSTNDPNETTDENKPKVWLRMRRDFRKIMNLRCVNDTDEIAMGMKWKNFSGLSNTITNSYQISSI